MRRGLMRTLLLMVRGQDLAIRSPVVSILKRNAYIEDAALQWLLIAMLAEAEGLIAGNVPYSSYANAASLLICQTIQQDVETLPILLISNVRLWMNKSESLLRRFSVASLESNAGWMTMRQFVDGIESDGKLPTIAPAFRDFFTLPTGRSRKGAQGTH